MTDTNLPLFRWMAQIKIKNENVFHVPRIRITLKNVRKFSNFQNLKFMNEWHIYIKFLWNQLTYISIKVSDLYFMIRCLSGFHNLLKQVIGRLFLQCVTVGLFKGTKLENLKRKVSLWSLSNRVFSIEYCFILIPYQATRKSFCSKAGRFCWL